MQPTGLTHVELCGMDDKGPGLLGTADSPADRREEGCEGWAPQDGQTCVSVEPSALIYP